MCHHFKARGLHPVPDVCHFHAEPQGRGGPRRPGPRREHLRGEGNSGRAEDEPRSEGHHEDARVWGRRHQDHQGRQRAAPRDADPTPHRLPHRQGRNSVEKYSALSF